MVPAALASGMVRSPVQDYLDRLHAKHVGLRDGRVATYIPELAKADPEWFGICIATTDGCVYEVGDSRQPFTIQSISKAFTYGLALEDRGPAAVLEKVGVEPSGEAFNSISLEPTGRPLNPMINAGAITTSSLVAGHSPADRLDRLLAVFSLYAGRPLVLDEAVYASERDTGHRNRAIGHLLRSFDVVTDDPNGALDLYFRQCSIAVDCRDLSVMAATLANGGLNPVTGERAVRHEFVERILSVMTTCGMYDYSGEWLYTIGLPAKSGVGGGILAVRPGQLGIGVFSPRLDARGNSVRGVAVCRDLACDFNLHFLRAARTARSSVRTHYSLAGVSSRRLRDPAERALLDAIGDRARIYELHGDLAFAGLEDVVRRIVEASPHLDVAVVDVRRVTHVQPCVSGLLVRLLIELGERGKQLVLVGARSHPQFLRALQEELTAADQWGRLIELPDLDTALEWCETRLIAADHGGAKGERGVSLAEHRLCAGLAPAALDRLEAILGTKRFEAGEVILRKGDPGDAMYLLMRGEVSVTVDLPEGQIKRLSTISPGMVFGELAIVDRSDRTADVRADAPVECRILSAADLDRLGETHPAIKVCLLENLLRNVHHMVGRLNQELWTLAR